jgi:hypothetical protein
MRRSIVVCGLFAVAGCSILQKPSTGPLYSEVVHPPGPANTAWVTLLRPEPGVAYAGEPAQIKVDGTPWGLVGYQGFKNIDVPNGKHQLEVGFAGGRCAIEIELDEGRHYYFEVDVRSSAAAAGILGGNVGAALEAAGKKCGGAFSVSPIEEEAALGKLSGLRQSDLY